MTQEKRAILAAVLSLAVLIAWSFFFPPQTGDKAPSAALPASVPPSTYFPSTPQPGLRGRLASETFSPVSAKIEKVTKETDLLTMEWTSAGGSLSKVEMKNYARQNLIPFEGERSLQLLCDGCNFALPGEGGYSQVAEGDSSVTYEAAGEGLLIRKEYEWKKDQYLLDLRVTVENRSKEALEGRLGLGWKARQFPDPPQGLLSFLKGPANKRTFVYRVGNEVVHDPKNESREVRGAVPWGGIEDRYFLISLISRKISSDQLMKLQGSAEGLEFSIYPAIVNLPPQGRYEEQYSFYLGPKQRDALQVAGTGVELEKAIDYGWFSLVAVPILKLLQIFHSVVRNWGLAIILLTLFVKLLMNPLTIKSMKQMKEMQKLQPKLAALKEKYKDDKQRLNQETMQIFKTHQVNPMGGCLPMLLQMPIYIALYKVLYNAIELYHAPFFWFYRDLSSPDPTFILPVLLGIAMVAQQKMTPSTSADPAQKQMMMIMPVMFTAFMLFLPLGLVLYIFVNTAASVLQQWMYQNEIGWKDLVKKFVPLTRSS